MKKLYNDYHTYLKEKFGCKVYRVGVDAGFTCPNRDGTKGRGGCVYCNDDGSRSDFADPSLPVRQQLERGMQRLSRDRNAQKFIAYFQAFSNTYAPAEKLKAVYDEATSFPLVVGISIGTRPDTIDREKLRMIADYCDAYDVWIEYGVQSVHDRTLERLNRRHSFADTLRAISMTRESGVLVSAHVILGLPGEDRTDMIETARTLSAIGINGVKIHLLHVLKGSALEKDLASGALRLMSQEEYVEAVCDFLEHLSPKIVIQRLTGEGNAKTHIAPEWARNKIKTIDLIRATLQKRGTYQGSAFSGKGVTVS